MTGRLKPDYYIRKIIFWATDDVRGTFITGAAEGTGAVQGVWVGDGGWIDGRSHEETTWASGRGEMDLDNIGHGGRDVDVPHDLPGQGRLTELPS